ncbi:MAG: hypothetical protein IAG13_21855, partial [Deltaproteobacteria bacterium]|nr:hypothetical protein [Nannocystaceae bacterium]
GRQLVETDPSAAGVHYDTTASEWGDPVLYLDAADAYYKAADADSEIALAEAGIERARIALDLLFFQLDAAADKTLRMVDTADIPDLIARANGTVKTGEDLIAQLRARADGAVAGADTAEPKEKRARKPVNGRALYSSGIAFTAIGGAVLAIGGVGLVLGAVRQNEAEDPDVYGSAYDDVADKGRSANLMAGIGLGLGGALVVGGVVMLIVGKRIQKKAPPKEPGAIARLARKKSMRVSPSLNGVAISGRF